MFGKGNSFLNRSIESARLAVDSIRGNATRSGLTIIGIVVGVAAVVIVASLLEGAQSLVVSATADFAPNVVRVEKASFQDFQSDGQAFAEAQSRRPDILSDDLQNLRLRLGNDFEVGAEGTASLPAKRGTKTLVGISVRGVTPNISKVTNTKIARGRSFVEADDRFRRSVCVIGQDVVDELFPGLDPLGQEFRLGQLAYEVVGIAESQGSLFGNSQDGFVLLPLETFEKVFGRRSRSLSLLVKANEETGITADDTIERVQVAMRIRRGLIFSDKKDNFSIVTADSVKAFAGSITGLIGTIIYPLTIVALFVGGVVVMNMMLAAVSERTREIGIRKALGATRLDILMQVLIESTMLTLLGGTIGLTIAFLLIRTVYFITAFPLSLPLWAVAMAFAVSCSVGIIFGVVPARKAAGLDPIDALRYE